MASNIECCARADANYAHLSQLLCRLVAVDGREAGADVARIAGALRRNAACPSDAVRWRGGRRDTASATSQARVHSVQERGEADTGECMRWLVNTRSRLQGHLGV